MAQKSSLVISYYLEAGCLGAKGDERILEFCRFLTMQLQQKQTKFYTWTVAQQLDKHHHFIYSINNKRLNNEQINRYFKAHNENFSGFEDLIDELVVNLIETYLGRS